LFTPITLLDAVQKGFVTGDGQPLLPGFPFKQQLDGTFRRLVQGLGMVGNGVFKQVLDALT
jgi:hypothetical protein